MNPQDFDNLACYVLLLFLRGQSPYFRQKWREIERAIPQNMKASFGLKPNATTPRTHI